MLRFGSKFIMKVFLSLFLLFFSVNFSHSQDSVITDGSHPALELSVLLRSDSTTRPSANWVDSNGNVLESYEDGAAASLNTGSVTTGDEATITVKASEAGISTLNDLTSIEWSAADVVGYTPSVDVTLSNGKKLVFEYANVAGGGQCGSAYPTGTVITFGNKGAEVNDGSYAWDNDGQPGPCSAAVTLNSVTDLANEFVLDTLANWKVNYGTVEIEKIEIEVDSWISDSSADVGGIKINGSEVSGEVLELSTLLYGGPSANWVDSNGNVLESYEDGAAASLNTGSVTTGDEATITVKASEAGISTLNDLTSIEWSAADVVGYTPSVDVTLSNGKKLVFEYANVAGGGQCGSAYPTGTVITFGNKGAEVNDGSYAWDNDGQPGSCGNEKTLQEVEDSDANTPLSETDVTSVFVLDTLANWKQHYGSEGIEKIEIEVDSWISDSSADVGNIKLNGIRVGTLSEPVESVVVAGEQIDLSAGGQVTVNTDDTADGSIIDSGVYTGVEDVLLDVTKREDNIPVVPGVEEFTIPANSPVFDISLQAQFVDESRANIKVDVAGGVEIEVCLPVPENISISDAVIVRYDDMWEALDSTENEEGEVCALTDSLSLFAVGQIKPDDDDENFFEDIFGCTLAAGKSENGIGLIGALLPLMLIPFVVVLRRRKSIQQ